MLIEKLVRNVEEFNRVCQMGPPGSKPGEFPSFKCLLLVREQGAEIGAGGGGAPKVVQKMGTSEKPVVRLHLLGTPSSALLTLSSCKAAKENKQMTVHNVRKAEPEDVALLIAPKPPKPLAQSMDLQSTIAGNAGMEEELNIFDEA